MKTRILILSLVMSSLFTHAQAQSRVGSGDQGIHGLLAATTRQIVPGSEVSVGIPDANSNERILVTADGLSKSAQGSEKKYCVSLIEKAEYGKADFSSDNSNYRICANLGTAIYVKGDLKVAIQYSFSIAYFEKKSNEALVVKLSKIQIPQNDKISYATVSLDLTNTEELNKYLYTAWLSDRKSRIEMYVCNRAPGLCGAYRRNGDFTEVKSNLVTLPDQNLQYYGSYLIEVIVGGVDSNGGTVYALPGVYKIKWFYKESNAYQVTTGIVLK